MKKNSQKFAILLISMLLFITCISFASCQTSGKNIKNYIDRTEYTRSTTDEGTVWSIRCFIRADDFNVKSAEKIVVTINGKEIVAKIPTYSAQNCFDVEYLDTKNRDSEPTIRSCYAYFSADVDEGDKGDDSGVTTDLTVVIIVGAVLLVIGSVIHFIAVPSNIRILTYISGGVFLLCVIGAFSFSVTEGFVMMGFFVAYLIVCRIITKFFLD